MLLTAEHYELMTMFERTRRGARLDKETKDLWPRGIIYQDGQVNEQFSAYRQGYAYAQCDMRSDIQNLEASRDGYRDDARVLHAALSRMAALHVPDGETPDWLSDALARTNALDDGPTGASA
ncbi:hypothetical protein [Xenophilus sp. Marseille-Q4582]|uniref:hypothetical protein n=1 Tax=Xenophilus sp. Marseille-Q4582 TaxID=2866600 RepID=UPI001CE49E67|nr:hypothetical protein [Xenophilus sp. Marseille-Q4582]